TATRRRTPPAASISSSSWPVATRGEAGSAVEEASDALALGRHVLAPEVDQLATERGIEEEVARQLRDRRVRSQAPEEIAHHGGQPMGQLLCEAAHAVGWSDPEHVDSAEHRVLVARFVVLHARVHALAVLDVDLDGVEHHRVEEDAGDLRDRRWLERARSD